MKKILLLAGILMLGFSLNAYSQGTPRTTKKQVNQQVRIQEGKASGELTPAENRKLQRGQARVQRHKEVARADGVVTPRERRILRAEQRKTSHNIYRKKHNQIEK